MKQKQTQFCKSNRLTGLVQLTVSLFILLFFAGSISAQVSTLKLSTTNSSSYFDITDSDEYSILRMRGDGRLGINQNTPTAGLHLVSNDGLLVQGTYNSGNTWNLGAGVRMHWYSRWGAFRVGGVDGTQWNEIYVGIYSFASGYNTIANAGYATAMGYFTTASGVYSTAMGGYTTASGNSSTAMGYNTIASGDYSTAMGYYTTASGISSTAMGRITTASGDYSTALGNNVVVNHEGSFLIGDNSILGTTNTSLANQMIMRFDGGYKFYSKWNLGSGVYMDGGVSGWSNMSDRNKKENFRPIDGEQLLEKISALPITEWNYKETDESIRYIGPMAQDFYAAFHLGGTDSLGINSFVVNGVNMAAIQVLIKRTDDLQIAKERVEELETELASQKKLINQLLTEFTKVKNVITELKKGKSKYYLRTALLKKEENYGNPSFSEGTPSDSGRSK